MASNSIGCTAGFSEEFAKAFVRENNPDYAVNWAIVSCSAAALMAALGVVTGAEFAGDVLMGLSLLCAVFFIITMFRTNEASAANEGETLDEFLEEHSFVKEFLE